MEQRIVVNDSISGQNASVNRRHWIDIDFQDLSYAVPQGRKGKKYILRNVHGRFKAGELTAILGASGAGKSTLLNVLAGYKCHGTSGSIHINGEPRNLKQFRNLSRYIMQEDLIQPQLTVDEVMMMAANLKLNRNVQENEKTNIILEILEMLRLSNARHTKTNKLSGGEKKRLSISLELVNNPPVLFLDEPTTGLDDLSSSQCINLLKILAQEGRTIICSLHTPSAKLFAIFDNVYVMSKGQCAYQGYGPDIVPFLRTKIGLECPLNYNPADFIIEVCCGEYGDYQAELVSAIANGKNKAQGNQIPAFSNTNTTEKKRISLSPSFEQTKTSGWNQFEILVKRMWLQMWRDKSYLLLKLVMHLILGLIIGNMYIGMGHDGSRTIFNFGFYFTCLIFFMYVPMMPVLLSFPLEIQYLKREHFNKWYGLPSYFWAWSVASLPCQFILGTMYLAMVYLFSDQPLEAGRILPFFGICLLTSVISESFGLLISSSLNVVNGMFMGPVMTVPYMVLCVYGFGEGYASIPFLIKIAMHFNYLRYAMEGISSVMLNGRERLKCPDDEDFCYFTDLDRFIEFMGLDNGILWVDIVALFTIFVVIRGTSYYLLSQRLAPNKTFRAIHCLGRFIKSRFGAP